MPDDPYAAIAKDDPYAAIATAPPVGFLDRDIPLDSYKHATLSGVQSIGRGMRDTAQGIVNTVRHPIDTLKGIAQLPSQVAQVPGAIRDINASPDPLGTYAKVGQETAGQGVGQAAAALATEGLARGINSAANSGAVSSAARRMYQSALKPSTILGTSEVANVVDTGLKAAIPVSEAGAEKLSGLINDLSDKVKAQISGGAKAGATIDPAAVAQRTQGLEARFANQVNPDADLNAIRASRQEFIKNQVRSLPPGQEGPVALRQIPVDEAQAMKQGTYQQLSSKAYGEMGSAVTESQKALARGIKEELEVQFPEIKGLNAQEGRYLNLDEVLQRAVRRINNHQLIGIGTPMAATAGAAAAGGPGAAVAAVLKLALDDPIVKSRLAIALNKAGTGMPYATATAKVGAYSGLLGDALTRGDHTNETPPQ